MHNYNIKNRKDQTLKDIIIEECMPYPLHWTNNEDLTIFD